MSGFFDKFETKSKLGGKAPPKTKTPRDQLKELIAAQRALLDRHIKTGERPEGRLWWKEDAGEEYVCVRYANQTLEIKPGEYWIRAGAKLTEIRPVLSVIEEACEAGYFDEQVEKIRKSFAGRGGRKKSPTLVEQIKADGGEVDGEDADEAPEASDEAHVAFPKRSTARRK